MEKEDEVFKYYRKLKDYTAKLNDSELTKLVNTLEEKFTLCVGRNSKESSDRSPGQQKGETMHRRHSVNPHTYVRIKVRRKDEPRAGRILGEAGQPVLYRNNSFIVTYEQLELLERTGIKIYNPKTMESR